LDKQTAGAFSDRHPDWQITGSIMVSIGIYFYQPPGDTGLNALPSEEAFLGVLTAYGLARIIGGVVDSLADPFVGWGWAEVTVRVFN
jgi:hypothetical protein